MTGITYDMLANKGACKRQADRFFELFGTDPAPMSTQLAEELADEFDWDWAARTLLTRRGWASYTKAEASARTVWMRGLPSQHDYFDRPTYLTAIKVGRVHYHRAIARSFAAIYIEENTKP